MTHDDALFYAEIKLGDKAKVLLGGELGEYIQGCSRQEVREAWEGLENCDPEDAKAIRKYQDQARQARMAISWLEEIIIKRDVNLNLIESEDD